MAKVSTASQMKEAETKFFLFLRELLRLEHISANILM